MLIALFVKNLSSYKSKATIMNQTIVSLIFFITLYAAIGSSTVLCKNSIENNRCSLDKIDSKGVCQKKISRSQQFRGIQIDYREWRTGEEQIRGENEGSTLPMWMILLLTVGAAVGLFYRVQLYVHHRSLHRSVHSTFQRSRCILT